MRSPLRILAILIAIALAITACSTTAVSSDERTPTTAAGNGGASEAPASNDEAEEATESPAVADPDDNADDEADTDSGSEADGESDQEPGTAATSGEEPSSARDLQSAPGFQLGGAEQLDALSEDCVAGNDMACDILFQVSGFDSDEEATAVTCGGRSEVAVTFCTEGIDVGPADLVFDEDSEGLATIITECREAGDMTACDFLFFRSPLGSDIELIGATCGERVEIAVPDCRTFLTDVE